MLATAGVWRDFFRSCSMVTAHAPVCLSKYRIQCCHCSGVHAYSNRAIMGSIVRVACAGEPVTIVALGGSITAGQGVVVAQDSYVSRLFRWVQVQPQNWTPSIKAISRLLPRLPRKLPCSLHLPSVRCVANCNLRSIVTTYLLYRIPSTMSGTSS